ncbi:unnamed protein product [Rangifer tarandus platyrhynchus]|uniref:Uncharacterized protein n=2 Tax=Rangifer tarandus platyrhynchus TaxID=3082113 RepID=A0ACB0FGR8_RANTA|nr:unnamed protein product [Rangifer tarandus platyrhynchus]CAI9712047.1 unnamed protein product [Rangifer tarandus platyrhynchus]
MQRGPLGQLPGLPDSEACPPRLVWLCVEPISWVTEKSRPAPTSGPGGAGPLVPAGHWMHMNSCSGMEPVASTSYCYDKPVSIECWSPCRWGDPVQREGPPWMQRPAVRIFEKSNDLASAEAGVDARPGAKPAVPLVVQLTERRGHDKTVVTFPELVPFAGDGCGPLPSSTRQAPHGRLAPPSAACWSGTTALQRDFTGEQPTRAAGPCANRAHLCKLERTCETRDPSRAGMRQRKRFCAAQLI